MIKKNEIGIDITSNLFPVNKKFSFNKTVSK